MKNIICRKFVAIGCLLDVQRKKKLQMKKKLNSSFKVAFNQSENHPQYKALTKFSNQLKNDNKRSL